MKSMAFATLAVAMAAPAMAQMSSAPSADPAPAAAPAPSAAPSDPAAILKAEFPTYDKDANGSLSKAEFSSWLIALKGAGPATEKMAPADEVKWLDKSFKDADADKNAGVNLAELTSYLTKPS
jgi:hypothetical protein